MTDNFSPSKIRRYVAGQDLSNKTGYAVTLNSARELVLATDTTDNIGILDAGVSIGSVGTVVVFGYVLGIAAEAITAGDSLSIAVDGRIAVSTGGNRYIGWANQDSVIGQPFEFFLNMRGVSVSGGAIETEIDAVEVSVGLNSNGTLPAFTAPITIAGSTSHKEALEALDVVVGDVEGIVPEVRTNNSAGSPTIAGNISALDSAIGSDAELTAVQSRTNSPITVNSSAYTKLGKLDDAIGADQTLITTDRASGHLLSNSNSIQTNIQRLDAFGGSFGVANQFTWGTGFNFSRLNTISTNLVQLRLQIGDNVTSTNYASNGNQIQANLSSLDSAMFTHQDKFNLSAFTAGEILYVSGGKLVNQAPGATSGVQPYNSNLTDIASLAHADGNIIVSDGANWTVEIGATARASLGLAIGTDVQAWDINLDQVAALTPTLDNLIVGNGSAWILTTPTTLKTTLGLVSGGTGDIWIEKTGDTMAGTLNMGANKVTSTYVPVSAEDLANKAYVDSIAAGFDPKASCKGTTTDDIAATYNPTGGTGGSGAFTAVDLTDDVIFDDVPTLSAYAIGDRIIIKDQVDPKENGIYVVTTAGAVGAIERSSDHDGTPAAEVSGGNTTFIEVGTLYQNIVFALQGDGILTLNTDDIVWIQVSGVSSVVAGAGLLRTGNTIDVNFGAGIAQLPSDEVGIDLYDAATGALILTNDGTSRGTTTAHQLHLLLNGSTLAQGASGLNVASAGITETEIASTALGDGLTGGSGTALSIDNDTVGTGGSKGTTSFNTGKLSVDLGSTSVTAAPGNHNHALDSLSDVDITAAADDDFIMYSGGSWIDRTAAQVTTTLGLTVGTNTQAWDANLDQIAALTPTDDFIIVGNGSAWVTETGATARASLGVSIGSQVQAWDINLDEIAALVPTNDNFIVGNGTNWTLETPSAVRTSLGLEAGGAGDIWVEKAGDTMTGTLNLPTNGLVVGTTQLVVSGNNVGIGTPTPASKLHVESSGATINVRDSNAFSAGVNGGAITFQGLDSGSSVRAFAQATGLSSGSNNGELSLLVRSAGTLSEAVRVNNLKYVGIGQPVPTSNLHVEGVQVGLLADFQNPAGNGGLRVRSGNNELNDGSEYVLDIRSGTSNNPLFNVQAGGNVGIGNATPSYRLESWTTGTGTAAGDNTALLISSAGTGRDANIRFGDNVNASARIGYLSGDLYLYTNGSERLRVSTAGKVTISTPTSGKSLTVNMQDNVTDAVQFLQGSNGYLSIDTVNSGERILIGNTITNPKTIILGGDTGFGITPTQKLHVASAGTLIALVQNTASSADARVRVQNTSGSADLGVDATGTYLQDNSSRPIRVFTGGSERVRVDNIGKVLIGTTSTTYGGQLTVRSAATDAFSIQNSNFVAAISGTQFNTYFGSTTGDTYAALQVNSGGGLTKHDLSLQPNGGNVGIGTTTPASKVHAKATTSGAPILTLTDTAGVGSGGRGASIALQGTSNATGPVESEFALIGGFKENATQGNTKGVLDLYTNNGTTRTHAVRIDSVQNTGFGTTTPGARVEINGKLLFSSGVNGIINSPNTVRINIDSDNNGTTEKFIIGNNQDSATAGNELFVVQENGNVGVGTGAGTVNRALEVNRTSAACDFEVKTTTSGVASVLINGTNTNTTVATASGGGEITLTNQSTTANTYNVIKSLDAGGQTTNTITFVNVSDANNEGLMIFSTRPSGGSLTARLRIESAGNVRPSTDNTLNLGTASFRWSEVFAGNATINTSDENLKQDIQSLDQAELNVALAIKGLIKKFRYKDSVSLKGDDARIQVGVIAQDVAAAFIAEGLDPNRYSLFCSNTWYEHTVEHTELVDDEEVITYTQEVSETFIEGSTEVTRLGIRYSQLLAFMIAAL